MRRQSIKRSLTTEDCVKFRKGIKNDRILRLISLMNKQEKLLQNINMFICNESRNFVMKHKHIFDKEKLKLIQIKGIIDNILKCGLRIRIKQVKIDDINYLNEQTFDEEWNELSREINIILAKVKKTYDKESCVINIINNVEVKENKKNNIVCIVFFIALILFLFLCICAMYMTKY